MGKDENEKYRPFEDALKRDSKLDGDSDFLVFVHPKQWKREYEEEEKPKLTNRSFASRLYICFEMSIDRTNVFLRTRHTDNAKYSSHLWQVRDYVKSGLGDDAAEGVGTGVNCMSEILRFCMRPEQSDKYYTWAYVLASALSNGASNTLFEGTYKHEQNIEKQVLKQKREKLIALMDIIFTKIQLRKFLCDDGAADANIYRVAYYNKDIYPRILAMFSFSLQVTLFVFVVLEVIDRFYLLLGEGLDSWEKPGLTAIAVFNVVYEAIVLQKGWDATNKASSVLYTTNKASSVLSQRSLFFEYLDRVSNIIFPIILGCLDSFIIATEDSYVGGLLNLTVFGFISHIDDDILNFVDIDVPDTIEDFLMSLAREQYQERVTKTCKLEKIPRAFSDIHVTGIPEMPSGDGYNFAIYAVNDSPGKYNPFVTVSNLVTKDCVFTKISGRFTDDTRNTANPYVNELRLDSIDGKTKQITYLCKEKEKGGEMDFEFEGYFCITSFAVRKSGIHKLRLCGVDKDCTSAEDKKKLFSGSDFVDAFEYYNLWDIDEDATKLLENHKSPAKLDSKMLTDI